MFQTNRGESEMTPLPEILLVDDNPADATLVREALAASTRLGTIHSVVDGEEAIAFLEGAGKFANAKRPDLVVLDLNLPRKDGRTVLAEMKANPKLIGIPVVIFSTSHARRDIVSSYELGANCYVNKPLNLEAFFKVVHGIEQFWFAVASLPRQGE